MNTTTSKLKNFGLFVITLASISFMGILLLAISFGSTETIAIESEQATLANTASISDTAASNGAFIEFKETIPTATTATYTVTFRGTWSPETHHDDHFCYCGAHFSPFVAYTHTGTTQATLLDAGILASDGIEDMAETGSTDTLLQEIADLVSGSHALDSAKGGSFSAPGTSISTIQASTDFPFATLVSMIAPSPDWFVGETAMLYENGQWVDQKEITLITWDAGTDSGIAYQAPDNDTQPPQPIKVFPDDNFQRHGTVEFIKQ